MKANDAPDAELLPEGNAFRVQRRGEDQRFTATKLRVPNGVLRDRVEDVLDPKRLAALHRGYRNRVQMGPTWRADVWTAFERDPDISVAECSRRVRCSFAVAWEVAQDFALLRVMGEREPTGWRATQSGARARGQSRRPASLKPRLLQVARGADRNSRTDVVRLRRFRCWEIGSEDTMVINSERLFHLPGGASACFVHYRALFLYMLRRRQWTPSEPSNHRISRAALRPSGSD